jgi:hypothetical protein
MSSAVGRGMLDSSNAVARPGDEAGRVLLGYLDGGMPTGIDAVESLVTGAACAMTLSS